MAKLIDGKALADKMQNELVEKVEKLKAEAGIVPGLVVILVGDDPASQVYVRNKERSAKKAGFLSETVRLSESTSEEELIQVIEQYNNDDRFHGILVQLPLPAHINDKRVILAIDPKKDVDGFHPINTGHLWNGRPVMVPCTPAGIMELLSAYEVDLEGKTAVIIGRSNIVGKPMAQLLLDKNATVTLAHSRTLDLARVTQQADVLIVAIGQGHFVTKEFVKEDAVVIDVGMNRDENGKLIGDVKFDEVEPLASLITPVPGGVGPMTITMLMEQTYQSALRSVKA
ncbi:bifunctional methylenetetrahydrofolate dehydrogenase/methenyltetrahydrofolate cyclohydrolase [Streptococcus lutetiensis]|uniref:bifunctional methylenetetrahydrofolate dehydrogenase/methenyltetrahydrofolate cyclohydrolase n=1 Tax=Streptococcus lutetiensis TaxID=150055 RepID=UPI0011805504|nr:bifunctional methylenetetrahydrofolate dehydrogenase/methenyltetrahydrofolate cyclohydrolase [Streptococcus lutetiensis]MBT0945439.1 bifunctional methylenetetrahydrofolate dehydrogenase/methenyltetrahydrofolate cyclohydrolase [Streptococcus lutetiensis]